MKAKRKSNLRFEQLNTLVDHILPTLKSSSQVAVALVCYRHARESGLFVVSTDRIAEATRLSPRQVKRVIDDLEGGGVIKFVKEHNGRIPRQYKFTGKAFNSDMGVTIAKS